ncbi:hypothetical protein [Alicyclobacillus sp. SO9]|uniref:hypothetical protein n=1 Tax=Alicyclobacillus sp. SO9 TaxID=2665646 RepID=UPI001E5BC5F4|nr:hypothetical protein [Alicyclobacillus sp. SO9]
MSRYTQEQTEFIREVAQGRYNTEIAALFNARFGTNVTDGQMKSFKANHQIKSNVLKRRRTEPAGLFTNEQKAFIKDNVKGLSNQKLADLVNKRFGLSITARQMNTWKKNHGLTSGLKGSEGMAHQTRGPEVYITLVGIRRHSRGGQGLIITCL